MKQQRCNVLGVIPARGGSKGIKRKNLAEISGKPLIWYTIDAARLSRLLSYYVVSTEDDEIASYAMSIGANVPFVRPQELAEDRSPSVDVVLHALHKVEELGHKRFDAVMLLQPTTPFRPPGLIDSAIQLLDSDSVDSVVSVVDVGAHHPHRMYTIADNRIVPLMEGITEPMAPRQVLPPVYIRSGDIYLVRRATLEANQTLIGSAPAPLVIPPTEAINIDTEADLLVARRMVEGNGS